jgi:peroxiredoxin family protein
MAEPGRSRPHKLSIIVFSGTFEKVHYALAAAAAAAAIDMPATLFFTMEASRSLEAAGEAGRPGWHSLDVARAGCTDAAALDADQRARGVAGFDELFESCVALGVRFMVCEMGLRAIGLEGRALRDDVAIEAGGLVSFLNDASPGGATLFI